MTVLWECRREGTHYSVRQSGASIRLYSNRVFHSQWNSNKPFAGGVWDCLSLPAFYLPEDSIKRVLLLGLGGGAVVRQLQIMTNFDQLNAIEIDQQHIDIARRWFGVNDDRVTLIHQFLDRFIALESKSRGCTRYELCELKRIKAGCSRIG